MARQLASILTVLLLAGTALGGTGTVTLKDGKEYKDVAYSVDTTDDVLIIEQGGWIQKILPERIERVVDRDGLDVTASILAALRFTPSADSSKTALPTVKPAVPATTSTPPPTDRQQRARRQRLRKPFDVAFSMRGNYAVPFDAYYEGFTGGLGFEGDVRISVSDELALLFLVSKSGIRISEDWLASLVKSPYVYESADLSTSVMRYYVGLVQMGRSGHRRDFPDLWYAYFGIGAVAHNIEGTYYARNTITQQREFAYVPPYSETRFAQVAGAGYIIRLSKSVGIDLSGSLEGVWTKVYNISTGAQSAAMKGFSFDLKAGVTMFPGK